MSRKVLEITWDEFLHRLRRLGIDEPSNCVYGVPKGGMIACAFLEHARVVHTPEGATHILDDIFDSGATKAFYYKKFPTIPFYAVVNKPDEGITDWVVLPWEKDHPGESTDTVQQNIIRLLQYIGEDPDREGLRETPDRIIRSWDEIFAGYRQRPQDVFKTFDDDKIGGLVYLKDIEFFSTCEHHWLPFSGKAHIGYIPNGPVIGASKLARLLDMYACRLQIQERLAEQVTGALMAYLKPLGAVCIIEARHLCMACRGVKKQHSVMGYSSVKGAFFDDARARAEFISLVT